MSTVLVGRSRVTVIDDDVASVLESLRALTRKEILVGIPESTSSRDDEDGKTPITNAALGYIHEFGAPEANIPARPSLIPGVERAQPQSIKYLRLAATSRLEGNVAKSDAALSAAGSNAADSVRDVILEGDFVPLSPVTIQLRHLSRNTKSMRKEEKIYLEMVANNVDPGEAQSIAGIKPLINTSEFLRSHTYIVRDKA
jgi:hypothetical protein